MRCSSVNASGISLASPAMGCVGAGAGDHVLALGVDQVVALELVLAGGDVAGGGHAGGRATPHVAEHHGDDVHRGAEVVGDAGGAPVVVGALALPRAEHRLGRQPELLDRVVRELAARLLADDASGSAR